MKPLTFTSYLQQKQYSPSTIRTYEKYLQQFTGWLAAEHLSADEVDYTVLLGFMRHLQSGGGSVKTVNMVLGVVRHYFAYRIVTGQSSHNPAMGVFMQGHCRKLPGHLLSTETLQALYATYNGLYSATLAQRVMLGLLVFQGVTLRELERLERTDVRIAAGVIHIRGGKTYNGRKLELDAAQVRLLDRYLVQAASASSKRQQLFPMAHLRNQLQRLFKHLKKLHPEIINAQQIRSSVITAWLKHYHLRQVQYMAGHKYASSTQRYQATELDSLQTQLDKHHPLETARFTTIAG